MGSKIEQIEYYLPNKIVDSKLLSQQFRTFDVDNKIGIKSRHVVVKETSLDLAYNAALKVLKSVPKEGIDFLVLCTQTPEYILPTTACILQDKLGLRKNIGAFDFNLGCSGYIYGLAICNGLISSGVASNILFVTADTYTKYIHIKDKGNRSIFGDGATATLISKNSHDHLGGFELYTDGSGYDKLIIKNGGAANEYDSLAAEKSYGDGNVFNDNCLYMNGPDIFNFTIKNIPNLIYSTLEKNKFSLEEIDFFIFHQANSFMLEYLRKKIKIDAKKFYINLENTGNTVSSTIPIALYDALDKKMIKKGDRVLLAGFGVGLSWGATLIQI
ncbi:unnamed protein product [Ectocarpus sp. 12 AP-2014]